MVNRDILTPKEVADLLRVDRRTLYYWIKHDTIRAFKVGRQWRIRRADLPQGEVRIHEDQNIRRNQAGQAPVPNL